MSRVGKKPIDVPKDVKINITPTALEVQGPKGNLKTPIPQGVTFKVEDGKLVAERQSDDQAAIHGLARALAQNAVTGVTTGFTQDMDVVGVGYKAELKGKTIVFSLGYSHQIEFPLPEGVAAKIEKLPRTINQYQATITISSADRQLLGQTAADLNRLRKPDAYKGKGVRYANRPLKLKPGKTGK
jgi:large subunit ribosomal protein L6